MNSYEISSEIMEQNQKTILTTLQQNHGSLPFLELKKQSKLANMYFLKALEKLKISSVVQETRKNSELWIKINQKEE